MWWIKVYARSLDVRLGRVWLFLSLRQIQVTYFRGSLVQCPMVVFDLLCPRRVWRTSSRYLTPKDERLLELAGHDGLITRYG